MALSIPSQPCIQRNQIIIFPCTLNDETKIPLMDSLLSNVLCVPAKMSMVPLCRPNKSRVPGTRCQLNSEKQVVCILIQIPSPPVFLDVSRKSFWNLAREQEIIHGQIPLHRQQSNYVQFKTTVIQAVLHGAKLKYTQSRLQDVSLNLKSQYSQNFPFIFNYYLLFVYFVAALPSFIKQSISIKISQLISVNVSESSFPYE